MITLSEQVIGNAHPNQIFETFTFSPDRRHIAYAAWESAVPAASASTSQSAKLGTGASAPITPKFRLMLDNRSTTLFDGIADNGLVFSPDSKTVAFAVDRGGRYSVMLMAVDAAEPRQLGSMYQHFIKNGIVFSPDGQRLAYMVANGTSRYVVLDGIERGPYERLFPTQCRFSEDSRHVAYPVFKASDEQFRMVIDAEEDGARYEGISEVVYSPNSQRLAYGCIRNQKWFVCCDGKESPNHDSIGTNLCFSPDSRRLAYKVAEEDASFMVIDGVQQQVYKSVSGFTFSPNGKRNAFTASVNNVHWSVIVDDRVGPKYDGIRLGTPVFSPDSQRVAYGAERNGQRFLVVDDAEGPPCEGIVEDGLAFSPDSKHLAYAAKLGDDICVFRDGKKGRPYRVATALRYSPDSQHLAYRAQDGERSVLIVDDEELAIASITDPVFDGPDSFHVLAARGNELLLVSGQIS